MMRNNDFDAIVSAKQALKSHIALKPSKSFAMDSAPPDEAPDDKYSPQRGMSVHNLKSNGSPRESAASAAL